MNILFCGAQGVGKSSVIEALVSKNPTWNVIPETVRRPELSNLLIDEKADYGTQSVIMEYQVKDIENVNRKSVNLFDRGVIDTFIFTLWIKEYSKVKDTLDYKNFLILEERFRHFKNSYDYVFFIEPEFDLPDDGFRSTNVEFQKQVNELFKRVFRDYNIPYIKLSGSVEERVEAVTRVLKEFS